MQSSTTTPTYMTTAWQLSAIRYFRQMGFFEVYNSWSDEQILKEVELDYQEEFFQELIEGARSAAEMDQILLQVDEKRISYGDLEIVYPGENAYVQTLQEWAAISRGALDIQSAAEIWDDHDEGRDVPIKIVFTANEADYVFVHPSGLIDFLQLDVLRLINRSIRETPFRFMASDNSYVDCNFVVVLTAEEKAKLQRERGWTFCESISDV